MNFFSTDVYLQTLADVYFAGKNCRVVNARVENQLFRLLMVDGQPITRWAFLDFLQPLENVRDDAADRDIGYLPKAVLRTHEVTARPELPPGEHPSPFIDWSRFESWSAFEAFVGARIGNLFPDSRRKRKKLERELGPIRFELDDRRPEVLEQCLVWKSSQYVATGLQDMFADPRNADLFRVLQKRGAVVVSSFSAGERLLAAHFGALADERLYWWVPAYDPAFGKYSPGRLMLEDLMKASLERKHREFDFLIGDETYKWHYATHNRVIGALGTPPLSLRLKTAAKQYAKKALARHPKLLETARGWKARLEQLVRAS